MRLIGTFGLSLGAAFLLRMNTLASPPQAVALPTEAHPLRFVQNKSQWQPSVLFAAEVPAGRLFLEKNRLLVARYDAQAVDEHHHHAATAQARIKAHAYAITFVGANPTPAVGGEQTTPERSNYFVGNTPARWATNVPAFEDVRYHQLYPGTDLRFYSRGPVMEYDFELAAGADAARIALRYSGQQSLRVTDNGSLQIGTSVGHVTEQRPVAYQLTADGRRQNVPCRYRLEAGHTVRFALPAGYDHARPLVIDPVLVYSTYSGATGQNWGYTACPDTLGNLYAASVNFASGYPATLGAYDLIFNGVVDIVVSKYNPTASGRSSLVSATYLGGGGDDRPHSLVVNRAGELVILGSSQAANATTTANTFPTTAGAFDRSFNGGTADLVVVKLGFGAPGAPGSSRLVASTFVGGSGIDGLSILTPNNNPPANPSPIYNNFGDNYRGDVIVDRQDNVYFSSVTRSLSSSARPYPTLNPYQATNRGGADAVITKLLPDLAGLVWSTHLGGTADDAAYSIQVDSLGGVFVAGGTLSTNFPGTTGGLNPSHGGTVANVDGFVAHLDPGGQLVQSTYLGTSTYDQAFFVQLDRRGAVYVLGQTSATGANGAPTYPVTPGVYRNAGSRQFIHKLTYGLNNTLFSTVIGNGPGPAPTAANPAPHNLSPTAFLVNNCGQILLSGWGASSIANMPTTPDALRTTAPNTAAPSGTDFNENTFGYLYLMQLSANGRRLVYGTYFGTGSAHVDGGTSRFDKSGTIYQAVCIRALPGGGRAPAIPVTANAYAPTQPSATTESAAFKMDVLRLEATFAPTVAGAPGASGCAPLTVTFVRPSSSTGGTRWDFGNGQTSTTANNVSSTYATPGTYTVTLTAYDSLSCQAAVSTTQTINVFGLPRPSAGPDQALCPGGTATLRIANASAQPNVAYTWSPATGLNTTTGPVVVATPPTTTQYIVTATLTGSGCPSQTDTVLVTVARPVRLPISFQPALPLAAQPVTFADSTGGTPISGVRTWDFGDGQTATGLSPVHSYAAPGTYTVVLTNTLPGLEACPARSSRTVVVVGETPNIITPNGDGLNDTFRPAVAPGTATLTVFNRWGRKVFEQANYAPTPSTGFGADPALAPGVYFYRVSTAAGQAWKGTVEVVR